MPYASAATGFVDAEAGAEIAPAAAAPPIAMVRNCLRLHSIRHLYMGKPAARQAIPCPPPYFANRLCLKMPIKSIGRKAGNTDVR